MTGLSILAVAAYSSGLLGLSDHSAGFVAACLSLAPGTLEIAADPFLSICGPPRYCEIRLNLAQAVQGCGSFVAPLLATRVFFAHTVDNSQGLQSVQRTYLGVSCSVALLFILFFLAPMPEITDADIGTQELEIAEYDPGPFRKQYNLFSPSGHNFATSARRSPLQERYFINFAVKAGRTSSQASDLLAVAQGLYAFNRLLAGALMIIPAIKPRYMLATYLGMCFIFAIAAITTSGTTSIALLILDFCFESCCFATIFALGLRGLGRHTKRVGSLLVAAISGGMVFPPMMGAVVTARSAHVAMAIPMMWYTLAYVFPVYVNFFNRETMDSRRDTNLNVEPRLSEKDIELERNASNEDGTSRTVEIVEQKPGQ